MSMNGNKERTIGNAVAIALLLIGAAAVAWYVFFGPGFCCLPAEQ